MVPETSPPGSFEGVRASDAERARVVDLLRDASTQGRLTIAELEERTGRALGARSRAELAALTADLPVPDAPSRRRLPRRARRVHKPERAQLAAFVAVNALLIVVWGATGAGYFWPIWPLLGWGIALVPKPVRGRSRGWPGLGMCAGHGPAGPRHRRRTS
jgi:hypothetical protein